MFLSNLPQDPDNVQAGPSPRHLISSQLLSGRWPALPVLLCCLRWLLMTRTSFLWGMCIAASESSLRKWLSCLRVSSGQVCNSREISKTTEEQSNRNVKVNNFHIWKLNLSKPIMVCFSSWRINGLTRLNFERKVICDLWGSWGEKVLTF